MEQKRIAIIGYGNIGKAVLEAVSTAPDFTLAGVVRTNPGEKQPVELTGVPVAGEIRNLGRVDAAVICTPSRSVPDMAAALLEQGVSCVDSYDIHSSIYELKERLDPVAKKSGSVSVISAGWDPGTDSVLRALLLAMAPAGITATDFGPGMSMGHSVCARGKEGVKDALSMTMPKGDGIHRRMVYVELEDGADFDAVTQSIQEDPYFCHDETHVILTPSVALLRDMGHGVSITRKGVSGTTHNQKFTFDMRINNPALTAQILVSTARAALRQKPGCYTMIELAPIDYLPGEREALIRALV